MGSCYNRATEVSCQVGTIMKAVSAWLCKCTLFNLERHCIHLRPLVNLLRDSNATPENSDSCPVERPPAVLPAATCQELGPRCVRRPSGSRRAPGHRSPFHSPGAPVGPRSGQARTPPGRLPRSSQSKQSQRTRLPKEQQALTVSRP